MPLDLTVFLGCTRYGTFDSVRKFAADAVFLLNGLKNTDVLNYFLNMLAYDPDPGFRYHLASSFSRLMSLKVLNQYNTRERDAINLWSFVDPEYLSTEEVGKSLWSILISPETDKRIRTEILYLCEIMYYLPSELAFQPGPKLKLKVSASLPVLDESAVWSIYPNFCGATFYYNQLKKTNIST